MTLRKAGDPVEVTVTYLQMEDRPDFAHPPAPHGEQVALLRAIDPPPWYFLTLYRAVGTQYEWVDRTQDAPETLQAFVGDPKVSMTTAIRNGWPAGFFMLDARRDGVTDLAYFGLVPEAVGKGLGSWLLKTAVLAGWDTPGTQKLTVNTCTLDHPRALPQYQRYGFRPVRQSHYTRVLTRDWDPATFP